jgi:glycosyltransferase involved in cell wall biosynthesis
VKIVQQVISGDLAGGQLVALRIAGAARAAGHESLIVSPSAGPLLDRARDENLATRIVPLGRSYRVDDAVRYARLLRAERVGLLHTHTHLAGNVLGRIAGRLAGVPVVAHMHIENVFRSDRAGRSVQVSLDNATTRLCARILAVSEATRASLVRQGYPAGRIEVLYNGVDLDAAEPVRLVDGPPVILHVGRLAPVKGQLELIRALATIDGAHAVLVGRDLERDGAYERELEQEAKRLGQEGRVHLVGSRDDVPGLLAGCDVLALPSWIEGLPLVVLEAMAQAKPVVATAVGGTPELVVDGETGLLVPPRDLEALADALRALLADPARMKSLGDAGRRRVEERFSAAAMTGRVLEVYAGVARTMRP